MSHFKQGAKRTLEHETRDGADVGSMTAEAFADYDTAAFQAQHSIANGIAKMVGRTDGSEGYVLEQGEPGMWRASRAGSG